MTYCVLPGIAIHSSIESVILPVGCSEADVASITEHKAQILATLRANQMDPAGFYKTLPAAIHQEMQAASWVVLDLMTTAETRYSLPERLSARKTCVGPETWQAYRAANPGTRVNTRPRMRILSIYTPTLGTCAWDLDALTPEESQRLFRAALENKILVAHNAGVVLSWLFFETSARPKFVLDSMLLVRQLRPETLLRPFKMAASGDEGAPMRAQKLIKQARGAPAASLEWVATSLRLPVPDVSYANHTSWGVSTLSPGHHTCATMSVELPLHIVRFLLSGSEVEEMPAVIQAKYPWYIPFSDSMVRLAEAHVQGVPFNMNASKELCAAYLAAIVQAADELVKIPEFALLYQELINPRAGESAELTMAFTKYAAANGIAVSQIEIGPLRTTNQAGRLSGADQLPAWNLLQTIKINKAGHRAVQQYQRAAAKDGRMHSLVTFVAATGRTTSIAPTLQNIPRDPRFRALVRARSGHLILAADYGAIELRIAAVLAERAISDLRQRIESGCNDSWFLGRITDGVHAQHTLRCPPEPKKMHLDWLEHAIPAVAQRVLRRDVQRMTSIFSRGLDPHLVTALDMDSRLGKIDCGRNPVEWLAAQGKQTQKDLKVRLHDQRQKAKPTNFGLLYGMSAEGLYTNGVDDYGLTWSMEEAAQSRHAWFSLYPEFRLWHWWTKFSQSRSIPPGTCMIWNFYEDKLINPGNNLKLFETTTLSGRPLRLLDEPRKALNYQDQGSGADILARAIAYLPDDVASMMLMPVHDELVFEVPQDESERVRVAVVETMTRAADEVLEPPSAPQDDCTELRELGELSRCLEPMLGTLPQHYRDALKITDLLLIRLFQQNTRCCGQL